MNMHSGLQNSIYFGNSPLKSGVNFISNKDLNDLFVKNNFIKTQSGSYERILSVKDKLSLSLKTGQNSDYFQRVAESPFGTEKQESFKGFLALWKDKKDIVKNFTKIFVLFNVLSKNSHNYDNANKIYADNKEYSELFENLVKNPPKNPKVFNSIRRYKGVDCGKINSTLRETNEYIFPEAEKEIKHIYNFIETQNVKNPIKLYRGEGFEILKNIELSNGKTLNLEKELSKADDADIVRLNKFLENNNVEVEQPSFMSTSTSKLKSNEFGNFYWELTTAPNTKACLIEPLTGQSFLEDEKEVLIQANSSIRIKNISYDKLFEKWCIKGVVSN